VKKTLSLILCLVILTLSLTACDSRYLSACRDALDLSGFSELLPTDDFYALGDRFTLDGKPLSSYLTYEYSTTYGGGKTNLNDTLVMKSETVPEDNKTYATTYQYLTVNRDLEGLILPSEIAIGDSLNTVLDKLTGDHDHFEHFKPTAEAIYEMHVLKDDTATVTLRDMALAIDTSGYRFRYQLIYSDTERLMTENGSQLLTRSIIFSFDNDAEGHPLVMVEIMLEARHRI